MNKFNSFYSSIVFIAYSSLSFAGGPLILEGPSGNTPVTYQNPAITVHVEEGDLGATSNAVANTILQEAFNLWNEVNTSTINLNINESLINVDINIDNYNLYLPNTAGTVFNANDNLNPIVYDDNGEIIDAFFGANQSESTIGFAASILITGASYFSEGYAVINGRDLGLTNTDYKLLIAHEIGHFFGLDHSQVNIDNSESIFSSPGICTTSSRDNYPLMYPFVCRNTESLHSDDISALSSLYPAASVSTVYGTLQGQFTDETGKALLGANIWAENTTSGETFSIVSDYLKQGNGYYKMLLPAGSYTLHANSINPLFNGGSGVGPYSLSITDISFISPHPIAEVSYLGTVEENSESSVEVITMSANQAITINFSSAGINTSSESDDDSFSDLFGGISYITLLLIAGLLFAPRLANNK